MQEVRIEQGDFVVLVGSPLSGKGTQSVHLSRLLQVPAVSTGDLFRAEAKTGSVLGLKMKEYMDRGELIPVQLSLPRLASPRLLLIVHYALPFVIE